MSTLSKAIADVKRKLGEPDERKLDEGTYIEFILEVDDELVTELNLSSISWLVPRFPLSVDPGDDIYLINKVNDFGRIDYVVTRKESDPNFNTRRVRVVSEPELISYFNGGDAGPSGVEHSALACALISKDGQPALRFAPIPEMAADYEVVYTPSTNRPQSKTAKNFKLEQFDGYLTDRAAFKMLPYAGLNEVDYQRIKEILAAEIVRGDGRFRRFKQSDRRTGNFRAVPFGASRRRR
jgi:hypothetical protein